jgi:hypothetical protein
MIRRRKRQFRIVHRQIAALEIEQAARTAKVVQQMTVDMKQIGIVADATDHVLVPDLGQQGSAGRLHCRILPFFILLWQMAPPPAAWRGLRSGCFPERDTVIKTYRRAGANGSFGGPAPTAARSTVASQPHAHIHRVHSAAVLLQHVQNFGGTDFALFSIGIMLASIQRA